MKQAVSTLKIVRDDRGVGRRGGGFENAQGTGLGGEREDGEEKERMKDKEGKSGIQKESEEIPF